jgi:hypothetical protein
VRRRLIIAIVPLTVVVIAGVVVSLRLFSEPACPSGAKAAVPVLVARQLIPNRTSGSVVVRRRLYAVAAIPCGDRTSGALADPSDLLGQVTVLDIFPGQRITRADLVSVDGALAGSKNHARGHGVVGRLAREDEGAGRAIALVGVDG